MNNTSLNKFISDCEKYEAEAIRRHMPKARTDGFTAAKLAATQLLTARAQARKGS